MGLRAGDILSGMREQTSCDFSALAVIDGKERCISWKWASGNLNDRYLNIRVRHGQGIEGEIIKVGRGMTWDKMDSKKANVHANYSIWLTERLESAYAVPVWIGKEMKGILLIGDRSPRIYEINQRETVNRVATELADNMEDLI